MRQVTILALLALVLGCEKKQEVDIRPDHLFTQCDGSQLRLPEDVLYSSVVREHKDRWEIQLRNGRYFYVQENPLEYLGISTVPCPDTVEVIKIRHLYPVYQDQMPPGRWVTPEFIHYWYPIREGLETFPDSVFVLSTHGEEE